MMNPLLWFLVNVAASFLVISPSYGWKPIAVGSPATYSLHQSHPGYGAKSHSINTLGGSDVPITLIPQSKLDPLGQGIHLVSATPASLGAAYSGDGYEESFGYKYTNPRILTAAIFGEDPCSVKKYAFNYDGTVQYKNKIPQLDQFTVCYWMRFTNHSGDHTLLTYHVKDEPREIQFWVANAKNASFLSMAIKGQQLYRLNYPLKTRQWHHTCTSWNGKTGEWQVWLKAERIGRGFHNSLVGHKIPANGMLYSGGPSTTGELSAGLHFEMTLVQIYRVALSAGKAHRDHKHHHVHHFDHEGKELVLTTKAPPPMKAPQPINNLLANGQIPTRVRLNLAQPQSRNQLISSVPSQLVGNQIVSNEREKPIQTMIQTNFVNGQYHAGSRLLTEQLIGTPAGPGPSIPQQYAHLSGNPANVQFIDETETRIYFKRETPGGRDGGKIVRKREAAARNDRNGKIVHKRGLVLLQDGAIVDDATYLGNDGNDNTGNGYEYKFDGLAEFGGDEFKHDLNMKMNIEDEIKEHDREPAEEEVKAVMGICGACDLEPFQGAIVFAWKDANAKMDNALKGLSVGRCGKF